MATDLSSYPLLVKVLADTLLDISIEQDRIPTGEEVAARFGPHIADRLEVALGDMCAWPDCLMERGSWDHRHPAGDLCAEGHRESLACHTFVPLVTP